VSDSLFTLRGLLRATTAADRALCLGLLAISLLVPSLARTAGEGPPRAIVTVGREQVAVLPLDEGGDTTVRGRLGEVRLRVEGGAVRVVASGCPRHVCVAEGAKRRAGEMIACVPNELLVRIVGGPRDADAPDAVTR
jgi:hypothetical protein